MLKSYLVIQGPAFAQVHLVDHYVRDRYAETHTQQANGGFVSELHPEIRGVECRHYLSDPDHRYLGCVHGVSAIQLVMDTWKRWRSRNHDHAV